MTVLYLSIDTYGEFYYLFVIVTTLCSDLWVFLTVELAVLNLEIHAPAIIVASTSPGTAYEPSEILDSGLLVVRADEDLGAPDESDDVGC